VQSINFKPVYKLPGRQSLVQTFALTALLLVCGFGTWALLVPLNFLFSGPDGTRWVMPFFIWACLAGSAYIIAVPMLYRKFGSVEAVAAWGVVVFFAGLMLFVAGQRLTSGLRHMESYNAVMALRVAAGQSLYPDPESGPLGTLYSPLYFLLSGFFYFVGPSNVAWGRVLSSAATVVTGFFVYKSILVLDKGRIAAIWGTALFFGTYGILQKLYDSVSVDPMQMCLTSAAIFYLLKNTSRGDAAALLFCGAACFTKQTAAIPFVSVVALMLFSRRPARAFWPLIACFVAGMALLAATRGWAWMYLVAQSSKHGWQGMPHFHLLIWTLGLQIPLIAGAGYEMGKRRNIRLNRFCV
jgi:hypothetical protein